MVALFGEGEREVIFLCELRRTGLSKTVGEIEFSRQGSSQKKQCITNIVSIKPVYAT